MFLFESIPWHSALMWVLVVAVLIGLSELTRVSKKAGIALFIVLPVILTIFVWPHTATAGSSTGSWFHWVKVYSALAGCIGFMALRYIPRFARNKYWLMFPAAILAINILEAVIRDFEVYGLDGMHDGVLMVGGPWNIMNGVAGILNIVTICGWAGIYIAQDRRGSRTMIWPDMLWFWIVAYDLWNFAYVYNAVGDHAFYAGAALLISCTIPAFFLTKGSWLQHRAQTLAFWMMFTMAVPAFVGSSMFAVGSSHDPAALFTMSAISLVANVAVVVYQVHRIVTRRKNPLKDELFTDLNAYQRVLRDNPPTVDVEPGSPVRAAVPVA